jgi:hypothetical protein
MKSLNKYSLIAPCGMNCGICTGAAKPQEEYSFISDPSYAFGAGLTSYRGFLLTPVVGMLKG